MNGVISEERASPVESRGHSRLRRRKAPTKKAAVETTSSCSHAHTRGVRRRQPWLQNVAYAPSFTPTEEEFRDPVAFIRRIEPEGAKYGICKITAPPEFRTRVDQFPEMLRSFTFTAREQKLREHVWDNFGKTEIIYEHAQPFNLKQFQRAADDSAEKLLKGSALLPPAYVESEFWRLRNSQDSRDVYILYGNDVEGTACDRTDKQNIGSTAWNLQDLGKAPWSLLRHAPIDYPGITTPMLYVGSLFSTFFWHVEDHWMHSINYGHYGAIKTWYGVPASHADAFEKVVLDKVYRRAMHSKKAELDDARSTRKYALKQLLAKNTLFLPKLLIEAGVPIFKLDQEPGDFVLTFPRGYHAGFSHGFNIGEAVNFALPEWLQDGQASLQRYCELGVPHILPHQLLLVKESAALFDRLQRTKRPPDRIDISTIQQFCAFADEHAQLRYRIAHEKDLEEVSAADPLKSQICFLCYRHICGCFIFHTETGIPRCMQCSVKASHIAHPEWKLAVPEVVGMMHYLEHQFWVHYGVSAPDHPLAWKIPRRKRSFSYRPPCLGRKRKPVEDDKGLDQIEDGQAGTGGVPNAAKRPRPSILEASDCIIVSTSNGKFPRMTLHDGRERYVLAQELLSAIGAPVACQSDVNRILQCCLLDPCASGTSPEAPLIKRPCKLPFGTDLCTVLDRHQVEQIYQALETPFQQDILAFLRGLWNNHDQNMDFEIVNQQ